MQFFYLEFDVTSVIKIDSKMWELWMHLDYDHFYIPLTSKWGKLQPQTIFVLVKRAYCCVGQHFWKKKKSFFPVWDLVATGEQIEKKLFCHWKNTLKLWRTWPLALPVHNILSHLHFFKVGEIMLKYGNLILPAGHILDLYCVVYRAMLPFAKIIQSFFSFISMQKDWIGGQVKFLVPFFQKKCPFWPISNAALIF